MIKKFFIDSFESFQQHLARSSTIQKTKSKQQKTLPTAKERKAKSSSKPNNKKPQQPKPAKIPKPPKQPKPIKTYKHTQYQKNRIQKGAKQEIQNNLWQIDVKQWRCVIQSQSSEIYQVTLSRQLTCTCPDNSQRYKPCKHIYFMIIQVAQYQQFCNRMRNSKKLSAANFNDLDAVLMERIKKRLSSPEVSVSIADEQEENSEDPCVICFKPKSDELFECRQCHNHLHLRCVIRWKSINNTCPLCRKMLPDLHDVREIVGKRDISNGEHLEKLTQVLI